MGRVRERVLPREVEPGGRHQAVHGSRRRALRPAVRRAGRWNVTQKERYELAATLRRMADKPGRIAPITLRNAADELERLGKVADEAWEVRREEKDYNPCP